MSGHRGDLIRHAVIGVPDQLVSPMSQMLDFILSNQYVDYGKLDQQQLGPVAQVVVGSGMGLACSGEISDKAFLKCASATLYWRLRCARDVPYDTLAGLRMICF